MNGTRQHGEDRKSLKKPHYRKGTLAQAAGKRSVRQRCPKCKKLRVQWIRANANWGERKFWERIEEGKPKVCHICVARHRGEPLPIVHGGPSGLEKVKPPREQPPALP